MVCPCGLRLSLGSPLPPVTGPGFIVRKLMRCLFTKGEVCPKSEEKILFQRKICYRTVKVGIQRQEQKLWGIFPWQSGPQDHFLTAVAKPAA